MSVLDTLAKWDMIIGQVPYRRDEEKESKAVVHIAVPHPDRTTEGKDKHLVCPGITWAELHEVFEHIRNK